MDAATQSSCFDLAAPCDGGSVCVSGACAGCGGSGQPCCTGARCGLGLSCSSEGKCAGCGGQGSSCCVGDAGWYCTDPGSSCVQGICSSCGALGGGACTLCADGGAGFSGYCASEGPRSYCNSGLVNPDAGSCEHCGSADESCCPDNSCTEGCCNISQKDRRWCDTSNCPSGLCHTIRNPFGADWGICYAGCGTSSGDPCCINAACSNVEVDGAPVVPKIPLACQPAPSVDAGVCTTCGIANSPCCNDGTCARDSAHPFLTCDRSSNTCLECGNPNASYGGAGYNPRVCCPNLGCQSGCCVDGTCVGVGVSCKGSDGAVVGTCGASGQCVSCGLYGQPCCQATDGGEFCLGQYLVCAAGDGGSSCKYPDDFLK